MVADFIQWSMYYLIFTAAFKLLLAKFQGTEWGPALAFFA